MSSANLLLDQFNSSRRYSLDLIETLSPEDCQAQSMEDASPAKWHLAHVTWFYEVMILKSFEKNFQYWNPKFAVLFNSYYNGVGDKHPRKQRGLLTRPTLKEVLDWRANIENRISALLVENASHELQWLIKMGINHEEQHQELILTDIQHLFYQNSLYPSYTAFTKDIPTKVNEWIEGVSGLVDIGFADAVQVAHDWEGQNSAHTLAYIPQRQVFVNPGNPSNSRDAQIIKIPLDQYPSNAVNWRYVDQTTDKFVNGFPGKKEKSLDIFLSNLHTLIFGY